MRNRKTPIFVTRNSKNAILTYLAVKDGSFNRADSYTEDDEQRSQDVNASFADERRRELIEIYAQWHTLQTSVLDAWSLVSMVSSHRRPARLTASLSTSFAHDTFPSLLMSSHVQERPARD